MEPFSLSTAGLQDSSSSARQSCGSPSSGVGEEEAGLRVVHLVTVTFGISSEHM